MAPRKMTIVRHGHREDFVGDSWSAEWGRSAERPDDPDLSAQGIREAEALAKRLATEPIRHVFASPFLRTVHTGSLSARALDLKVKVEDGFHEWINPDWLLTFPIVLSLEELQRRFGNLDLSYVSRGQRTFPEPDLDGVGKRALVAIQKILEDFEGDLLIVSHADPVKAMISALGAGEIPDPVRTTGVYRLVESGAGWKLELEGCTEHLSSWE